MQTSRRTVLFGSAAVLALPGCTMLGQMGVNVGAMTDAQVLADASGIVNQLAALVPQISNVAPSVVSAGTVTMAQTVLSLAKGLLAGLSPNVQATAGANTLLTVEGYINQVLDALAAVSPAAAVAFPPLAPFVLPLEAVAALLPGVEAFINQFVTTAAPVTTAAMRAKSVAPAMTPAQARAIIGVPLVTAVSGRAGAAMTPEQARGIIGVPVVK